MRERYHIPLKRTEFNMKLELMLEFLQNMEETFLSYKIPMM
jgi:hypothetical protein